MDPLLTLVAVLCGSALLGWEGALIAVPVAAVVQVILEEVVVPARLARFGEDQPAAQPPQPAAPQPEPAPRILTGRRQPGT
jgi:predicted PurR-regulated permease PerM